MPSDKIFDLTKRLNQARTENEENFRNFLWIMTHLDNPISFNEDVLQEVYGSDHEKVKALLSFQKYVSQIQANTGDIYCLGRCIRELLEFMEYDVGKSLILSFNRLPDAEKCVLAQAFALILYGNVELLYELKFEWRVIVASLVQQFGIKYVSNQVLTLEDFCIGLRHVALPGIVFSDEGDDDDFDDFK